jgi:hypothetical protein
MRRLGTFVFAVCLIGCSSNPAPVPVEGDFEALRWLAGEWVGQYDNRSAGRSGSIVFNLRADDLSTASGDVLMFSRLVSEPLNPSHRTAPAAQGTQVLRITFVRAEGDQVRGKLDAYEDPETGATINTTFVGRKSGDGIEGTFEAWSSERATPQTGLWKVTRRR